MESDVGLVSGTDALQFHQNQSCYFPPAARTALNVPCLEARSPTEGENSTTPVTESGFSNLPFNVNIPGSRPTLPTANSIGPAKVSEFPLPRVHFASEELVAPQAFAFGSISAKVPLPSACASKRSECWPPASKLISMFQMPLMFGDCAWASAKQHSWASTQSVNSGVCIEKVTTKQR
jgi:hypothetical protein